MKGTLTSVASPGFWGESLWSCSLQGWPPANCKANYLLPSPVLRAAQSCLSSVPSPVFVPKPMQDAFLIDIWKRVEDTGMRNWKRSFLNKNNTYTYLFFKGKEYSKGNHNSKRAITCLFSSFRTSCFSHSDPPISTHFHLALPPGICIYFHFKTMCLPVYLFLLLTLSTVFLLRSLDPLSSPLLLDLQSSSITTGGRNGHCLHHDKYW